MVSEIPPFLERQDPQYEAEQQHEYTVVLSPITVDALDSLIRFSGDVFPAQPDLETVDINGIPAGRYKDCLLVLKRLQSGVPFDSEEKLQEGTEEQLVAVSLRERGMDVINSVLVDEISYMGEGIRDIVPGRDSDLYETVSSRKVPGIMMLLHAVNGAFIQAGAMPRPAYKNLFEE